MDEKLDEFLPSLETLSGVRRQLISAGIKAEDINEEWLVTVVAAMSKWMTRTTDGLEFVVASLGFQRRMGDDDKIYRYIEPTTQNVYEIPPNQVRFFAGAALKGFPINPIDLEVSERRTEQCEGCGIVAHCLKEVRDPISDRLERLCNNCLWQSDNWRIKDHGDPMICQECTVLGCHHHPRKQNSLRA